MKKILLVALALLLYWLVVKFAAKFMGFNNLGADDDTDAAGTQPEVAGESKREVR